MVTFPEGEVRDWWWRCQERAKLAARQRCWGFDDEGASLVLRNTFSGCVDVFRMLECQARFCPLALPALDQALTPTCGVGTRLTRVATRFAKGAFGPGSLLLPKHRSSCS